MTLPPRIAKAPKRSTRWRSAAHCNFIRSHHCAIPDCRDLPIEVAHVRLGSGAGIGQKPDDWRTVPLCRAHHAMQHTIGEASFWREFNTDVEALIDAFCKASPKAREIREARA